MSNQQSEYAPMLFYLTRENIGLLNYSVKEKEWDKLTPVAKERFVTFANLVKQLKGVDDLDIDDSPKKDPPEWATWRKDIFKHLKEKRTYKLTAGQRAGEAKMMSWLFKQGYTPEQIIKAYDTMNAQPFWSDKPLTIMSVAKQIGAMSQKKDDHEIALDKFKNQKYSHIIQS